MQYSSADDAAQGAGALWATAATMTHAAAVAVFVERVTRCAMKKKAANPNRGTHQRAFSAATSGLVTAHVIRAIPGTKALHAEVAPFRARHAARVHLWP